MKADNFDQLLTHFQVDAEQPKNRVKKRCAHCHGLFFTHFIHTQFCSVRCAAEVQTRCEMES